MALSGTKIKCLLINEFASNAMLSNDKEPKLFATNGRTIVTSNVNTGPLAGFFVSYALMLSRNE